VSRGSSASSAPSTPQGELVFQGGQQVGSRVWDPSRNAFITQTMQTDAAKRAQGLAEGGLANIAQQAGMIDMSPAGRDRYAAQIFQPQERQINRAYDQLTGQAVTGAYGSGMQDSAGFANFLADKVASNRGRDLADAQNQAQLQAFEMPNQQIQPLMNMANLYSGILTGDQNRMAQIGGQAMQGAQLGGQQWANQMQMNQARRQNSGFLGKLLGM